MSDPGPAASLDGFPAAGTWLSGVGGVRDVVRQELVAEQLARHLPATPGRAVDLGCGQGTQAIRLARAGWTVAGADVSDQLLAAAERALAAEPAAVARRVTLQRLDLAAAPAQLGGADLVCCHGVLMYLPSLAEGVAAVTATARPGGVVSLLTRNQAGIALRAGMTGDWAAVAPAVDATHYRNRLGVEAARADRPGEVAAALAAAGATVTGWYGVRLLCDHWASPELPDGLGDLVAAERALGERDPYRAVCALTHTLARREPSPTAA